MNRLRVSLFVLFVVGCSGCRKADDVRPPVTNHLQQQANGAQSETVTKIAEAINAASGYLVSHCDANGRFTYIALPKSFEAPTPTYNLLRHAGSMYSLTMAYERAPDESVRKTLLNANRFLQRHIGPVDDNPQLLAVWTTAEATGIDQPRQVKLGGAGLALVAQSSLEKIAPGTTSRDQLRALGRFLLYMQRDDGSFYSKYFPDRGRDSQWTSMYYPGEAALGLLMLYEMDPQQMWLQGAARAIVHLARSQSHLEVTLPDQWALLATAKLAPLYDQCQPQPADWSVILTHAQRICRDMTNDQKDQLGHPQWHGCFTPDGRTCPSATRLEGLNAALQFLPSDDPLRADVEQAVDRGTAFLIAAQLKGELNGGELNGGWPAAVKAPNQLTAPIRIAEVRVDYVQHAMSALIQSEQRMKAESSSTPTGGSKE